MQYILVPVDFSPVSRNAAIYAAELAKLYNARLLLFHAYMLPTPVSEVPYVMVTADEMQKENENFIKKEAAHLHDTYGIEVEWMVRIGVASDEVKLLIKEKGTDMVVMGMKGAGGLDKIIGSTTTNVIRKVRVPVLIIPQDATYTTLRHITYASDFSDKINPTLLSPLVELAEKFQAKVHILHVQKPGEGHKVEDLPGTKANALVFANHDHEFATAVDGSINHGISEYLQHHDSQLLAMVAHRHTFFERVFSRGHTASMAYETRIPLLVLQDKE